MRRPHKGQTDSKFYHKWLSNSLSDLRAAKVLLTYNEDLEIVAFHCQQCIEKALKGYLLFKTGRHFDGHNITFLCKQAMVQDVQFTEFLPDTVGLNNLYIETRYPSDIAEELTEYDVSQLLSLAERIFSVIREQLYEAKLFKTEKNKPKKR